MKEYTFEQGEVNVDSLSAEFMDKNSYVEAHKNLVIPCHDAFIEYNGGILLIERLNLPAVGILWPLGGRVQRGMNTEDSLRLKVREESGLELENIEEIGHARTFFSTDPFGHGKGTDTINIVYSARGTGAVSLDGLHEKPTIVRPRDYTAEFRKGLHPYVKDFMDIVMDNKR